MLLRVKYGTPSECGTMCCTKVPVNIRSEHRCYLPVTCFHVNMTSPPVGGCLHCGGNVRLGLVYVFACRGQ